MHRTAFILSVVLLAGLISACSTSSPIQTTTAVQDIWRVSRCPAVSTPTVVIHGNPLTGPGDIATAGGCTYF